MWQIKLDSGASSSHSYNVKHDHDYIEILGWSKNLLLIKILLPYYDSTKKVVTFTREPWGIGGEPSALFGKKISHTPKSFCSQTTNKFHVKQCPWKGKEKDSKTTSNGETTYPGHNISIRIPVVEISNKCRRLEL